MDDKMAYLLEEFTVWQRRRSLSYRTISARQRVMEHFARHSDPLDCDRDDIEAWLATCRIGEDGRRSYVSHLSTFYKWAITEGWLTVNPTARIPVGRRRRRLPRPIPASQLEPAIAAADNRMRCWLLLGCVAGARCQEIAWLDGADVFLHETPPHLFIAHGKGDDERIVPAHPRLVVALATYGVPAAGPVFPIKGTWANPAVVSNYICAYLRGFGIEKGAHRLRHTFGTGFYRLSKNLRLTQEAMGHRDPATTALYTQVEASDAYDVVSRL